MWRVPTVVRMIHRVYKNTFRFIVSNEKEYIQYSFTSGRSYNPGDRVTINYVSSNPMFSVIVGARYSVFGIRECSELMDSAVTYKNGIWKLGLNKKDFLMGIVYWLLGYTPWIGLVTAIIITLNDFGITF